MRSEHDKNLLYDYVNGLLSDNEKTEFEKQLARSVDLQNDLKRVQQYYSLVKSSEQSAVPRNFIDNIHRKIGIYNELPENEISPVPLVPSRNQSVSAGAQKEDTDSNRFKSRFKRRFSFEVAGVLATVAILIFIFIPNVNIPEKTKNALYDEPLVQEAEDKSNVTEPQQLDADKLIPEGDITKSVVKSDNVNASDDERLSVKVKDEKKSIPKKTSAQSPAKGMIAKERVSQDVSASPVPSASPSMSVSSVPSAATTEESAHNGYTKEIPAQVPPVPSIVMSSNIPDESRSDKPVRIIMTAAMKQELNEAPLSVQSEAEMTKTRRSARMSKKELKAKNEESEIAVKRSADAETATGPEIEKHELEAMFSEHGIIWKCLYQDAGKLVYSLNGSTKAITSLVNKLVLRGFVANANTDFSNDSVTVELEIRY